MFVFYILSFYITFIDCKFKNKLMMVKNVFCDYRSFQYVNRLKEKNQKIDKTK